MITIPVDTNSMAQDGLVVASTRRVKGTVRVGDKVRVDDSAEGAFFDAVVTAVEERRIYLEIDWDSQFQEVEFRDNVLAWPTFKDYVSLVQTTVSSLTPITTVPTRSHVGKSDLTITGVLI